VLVIEEIKKVTCLEFGLSKAEIEGRQRKRDVAVPRMLAMSLSRQLTSLSLNAIGRRFGGRDHSTVIYACRKINPHLMIVAQRLPAKAAPRDWVKALQVTMGLS
jgi:chromosomal replication initiator protein